MFSDDALRIWTDMINTAFNENPSVLSMEIGMIEYIPNVEFLKEKYDPKELRSISQITIEHPTKKLINLRALLRKERANYLLNSAWHVALGADIKLYEPHTPERTVRFDIIDVEPGWSIVDIVKTPELKKAYNIIKTTNSLHLYPRNNVFGDNGGKVIKDMQWKLGYLRVTENGDKGRLELLK